MTLLFVHLCHVIAWLALFITSVQSCCNSKTGWILTVMIVVAAFLGAVFSALLLLSRLEIKP